MHTATFIWSFHCLVSFLPVCLCLAHVCWGEQHCELFHALKGNYLRPFSISKKRTVWSNRLIRCTLLGSEHFAREGEGLLEQVEYDHNNLYNAYTLLIHQLQNIHKLNNESTVLDISDPIRLGTVLNLPHICSSLAYLLTPLYLALKSHLNLNFVLVFIPALTQCPLFL